MIIVRRVVGAAVFSGCALLSVPALAGPDLVVARDYTDLAYGGCAFDAPLASGRIAIENRGDAVAELPLGLIDRYTRSMVAIYVPEHLDLLDHGRSNTFLTPGERALVDFEIGRNRVKSGRLIDETAFSPGDPVPIEALSTDVIRDYQRAFADLGMYDLDIDGIPGPGFRRAVELFQSDIGRAQTGVLTIDDVRLLAERTGRALETGAERAPGEVRVTIYAVVDPYNLIAEDDETNNIVVFSGVLDCSAT